MKIVDIRTDIIEHRKMQGLSPGLWAARSICYFLFSPTSIVINCFSDSTTCQYLPTIHTLFNNYKNISDHRANQTKLQTRQRFNGYSRSKRKELLYTRGCLKPGLKSRWFASTSRLRIGSSQTRNFHLIHCILLCYTYHKALFVLVQKGNLTRLHGTGGTSRNLRGMKNAQPALLHHPATRNFGSFY